MAKNGMPTNLRREALELIETVEQEYVFDLPSGLCSIRPASR